MEYVFDFMRLLSGNRGTGGARRRSGPGLALQLRLVFYGVLIGLMVPTLRKIDWSPLVPPGLKVEWPTGFGVTWPAGQLHVPGGWGRLRDTAADVAPFAAMPDPRAEAARAASIPRQPSPQAPPGESLPWQEPGIRRSRPLPYACLLYTSPSPRDPKTSRMPSSA